MCRQGSVFLIRHSRENGNRCLDVGCVGIRGLPFRGSDTHKPYKSVVMNRSPFSCRGFVDATGIGDVEPVGVQCPDD